VAEDLAQAIFERNPTAARDLVTVFDQWEAFTKWRAEQWKRGESLGHEDDEAYFGAMDDLRRRLRPLRDALEKLNN
jgi:hypothetical protein